MTATLTIPGRPAENVLIMQAERDASGTMNYAVMGHHQIREASDRELSNIKPLNS